MSATSSKMAKQHANCCNRQLAFATGQSHEHFDYQLLQRHNGLFRYICHVYYESKFN